MRKRRYKTTTNETVRVHPASPLIVVASGIGIESLRRLRYDYRASP
jgi:hypothetical protein